MSSAQLPGWGSLLRGRVEAKGTWDGLRHSERSAGSSRTRRSSADVEEVAEQVLGYVRAHPGPRLEEIGRGLASLVQPEESSTRKRKRWRHSWCMRCPPRTLSASASASSAGFSRRRVYVAGYDA